MRRFIRISPHKGRIGLGQAVRYRSKKSASGASTQVIPAINRNNRLGASMTESPYASKDQCPASAA
jgi:hypothetical protein